MKLICVSRFSNHEHSFEAGQQVIVSEEAGALLMRCSPGSFEPWDPPETAPKPKRKLDPVAAMSTETATGITAPDRRARGGRKRTTKNRSGNA